MKRIFLISPLLVFLMSAPAPALAARCSDYPNQAAAQAAHDTIDLDGDGIYCESLPCPCAKPGDESGSGGSSGGSNSTSSDDGKNPDGCQRPKRVQNISFSGTKYPNIRAHFLAAVKKGWPRILVLNRPGAAARRKRLLQGIPTRPGYDRDEYPPAVGRGRGKGLIAGSSPIGWKADVQYVPSAENRSHGSSMGVKLRRFCNGTRFRYVFY